MLLMDKAGLESLLTHSEPGCLSLLIPARRSGASPRIPAPRQNRLLAKAGEELRLAALSPAETRRRLESARTFLAGDFTARTQDKGYALFVGAGPANIYRTPLALEELVTVSDHFYLKSFFPLLIPQRFFFLLALSQNAVRLFRAQAGAIEPIAVVGAPSSLSDLLKNYYKSKNRRAAARPPRLTHLIPDTGERPSVDPRRTNESGKQFYLEQYCQLVDQGVAARLRDEDAPLVLAATEPLNFLYRVANTYRNLTDAGLHADPDFISPEELLRQARRIRSLGADLRRLLALRRHRELAQAGQAIHDRRRVLEAALKGQVETLFLARRGHLWGAFNSGKQRWEIHGSRRAGDVDLFNRMAVTTYRTGGEVFLLERESLPKGKPLSATLRLHESRDN